MNRIKIINQVWLGLPSPLLSSDNLLTGYKQLSYQQFNQNLSISVSVSKN